MTDNDLFTLVRARLLAQMPGRGLNGWEVARKSQPLQQGPNSAPTVYLVKMGNDQRVGSPRTTYSYDAAGLRMVASESQQMATTFQASIDMDESTDPAALTPSDAANIVAAIMQSDEAVAAFRAAGVGIQRIGQVLNPYNVDDRNRFDLNASFDFVLTYRREFQGTASYAETVESSVNRV